MATYTYSIVTDFSSNSVNLSQLKQEIQVTITITTAISHITQHGDIIDNVFAGTLTDAEKAILDGIVAAHTPNPIYDQNLATVHVGDGFEYSTIKEAVQYFTDNGIPGSIIVYPGSYYENNPITLPPRVTIRSYGGAVNTFVIATNPNTHMFIMSDNSEINGMGFNAGLMSGVNACYFDGSTAAFTTVRDSYFINLDSCCISDNGPGLFLVEEAICSGTVTPPTTINTCFKAINGGDLRVFTTGISGRTGVSSIGYAGACIGKNSINQMPSFLLFNSVNVQLANAGVQVDDGGRLELQSCILRYTGTAMVVGSNGTDSELSANGVTIIGSIQYDLDIQTTGVSNIVMNAMRIQNNKINNPNNTTIIVSGFSDEIDDKGQIILGKLNVGSVNESTTATFGEGGSYNQNVKYFHHDGAVWTDKDDLKTVSPSEINIFGDGVAGNSLYIGGDFKFSGLTYWISQLIDLGSGSLVFEYWNGSGWTGFHLMTTLATEPYYTLAETLFDSSIVLSGSRKYYSRFGYMSGWALHDVNTYNKYWVRIRVSGTITQVPLIDRMKIHSNAHKINDSGATEYFGNARPVVRLDWDINTAKPANLAPTDGDVYLSDSINVGRTKNVFGSSTTNRIGLNRYIPADMDTSIPLDIVWSWMTSETTGDVKWVIRWGFSDNNSLVGASSGDVPTTFTNEQSLELVETVSAVSMIKKTSTVRMNFCKASSRPESGDLTNSDLLWMTIERVGDDVADTCAGTVYMINLTPHYAKWRSGAFLNMYA